MFAGALPEGLMSKMGKIYRGKPVRVKSRKELLAATRPSHWQYLREDCGDLPEGYKPRAAHALKPLPVLN